MGRSIQSEWVFLQHITTNTGDVFAGVDKMIQETFLPRIIFGKTKLLSPIVGFISIMPVMKSGLGLLNVVTSTNDKYLSLKGASTELIRAVMG